MYRPSIFLSLMTGALLVAGCVSEPPPPYAGPAPGEPSIWERPPVYGPENGRGYPSPPAQRYDPRGQMAMNDQNMPVYPQGGNRYGAAPQDVRRNNSYGRQPQPQPTPEPPRQSASSGNQSSPPRQSAPQTPPPPKKETPPPSSSSGSSMADSGNSGSSGGSNRPPASSSSSSSGSSGSSGSKSKSNSGEFDHLPFAVPVPGKEGYVTLPSAGENLPEIDVRGIAPGTPVEIPDPNNSEKTIQFRVP